MIQFNRIFNNNQANIIKLICITGSTAVTIRHLTTDTLAKTPSINEKLINVHLFSRHGARTPLYLVSGIEEAHYEEDLLKPYVNANYVLKDLKGNDFKNDMSYYDQMNFNNKLKGGAGRGQLTKVGEKQMFDLGRRVRDKYIKELKFMKADYDPQELYSRSSHFKRTINSAKSFLAGIYGKSNCDDKNEPYIINVNDLQEDYIFPNAIDCAYYLEMYKFMETIENLERFTKNKNYIKHLSDLNNKLFDNKENMFLTFTKFRDDMVARQIHGLPVPKEFEEEYEKSHHFASKELSNIAKHNLKISCGRLLNMLKQNIDDITSKDTSQRSDFHKFKYYSAHDTTLNALLNAFDLISDDNEIWPPFAANIAFELWKETKEDTNEHEYYMKIFYCEKPVKLNTNVLRDDPYKLKLVDFIESLERHATTQEHYEIMCSRKFTVT